MGLCVPISYDIKGVLTVTEMGIQFAILLCYAPTEPWG